MTLNRNHHPNGGVLVQAGESILRECKNVEISFSDVTPKNDLFKGTKKGSIYLTQYRMVFVSSTMKEKFCSFMFPYYLMKNCSIEQPVFAANYIQGLIKAEAGGGWEGQANFKMSFPSGGAIELGQHLFKLATNASRAPPAQNGAFGLAAGMNGYASPAMPQPYPYPTGVNSSSGHMVQVHCVQLFIFCFYCSKQRHEKTTPFTFFQNNKEMCLDFDDKLCLLSSCFMGQSVSLS
uniref:WBP2 N-terminal like n=1 Tax=Cyprinus carpio TaxID=7962 RepID=A0A8C1MRW2_CYPCA